MRSFCQDRLGTSKGKALKKRLPFSQVFGGSIQLVDEEYIEAMMTPQFPAAINNYGLLTWLSNKGAPPSNCCQPQWLCDQVPGSQAQQGGGDASAADGGRWGALRTGESLMTELEFASGPTPISIEDGLGTCLQVPNTYPACLHVLCACMASPQQVCVNHASG